MTKEEIMAYFDEREKKWATIFEKQNLMLNECREKITNLQNIIDIQQHNKKEELAVTQPESIIQEQDPITHQKDETKHTKQKRFVTNTKNEKKRPKKEKKVTFNL